MKMEMISFITVFCYVMLSSTFVQSQREPITKSNTDSTEKQGVISQKNSTSVTPDGKLQNTLAVTSEGGYTNTSASANSSESSTAMSSILNPTAVSVPNETGNKNTHTSVTISPAGSTALPLLTNLSAVTNTSTAKPYTTANNKETSSFSLDLKTLSSPTSKNALTTLAFKTTKTEFSTARVPESTDAYTQYTGSLYSVLTSQTVVGRKFSLNNSEIILTIVFSIVLGVAVLVLIMYSVNKCKKRREQYSHHRLETIPYDDTADTYSVPDDTLVISGGLYDVPRVYNPTVSTLEDDNVLDYLHFTSRPGNFRLEFLPEETEKEPSYMRTNFETFA